MLWKEARIPGENTETWIEPGSSCCGVPVLTIVPPCKPEIDTKRKWVNTLLLVHNTQTQQTVQVKWPMPRGNKMWHYTPAVADLRTQTISSGITFVLHQNPTNFHFSLAKLVCEVLQVRFQQWGKKVCAVQTNQMPMQQSADVKGNKPERFVTTFQKSHLLHC